jgi:hypothetical protein
MRRRNVALAFGAGLLGGVLSHYLSPQVAQAQPPAPMVREERAKSFVLVDDKGVVLGRFCNERGRASLKLFDERGHEIWAIGGDIGTERQAALGK